MRIITVMNPNPYTMRQICIINGRKYKCSEFSILRMLLWSLGRKVEDFSNSGIIGYTFTV